MKDEGTYIPELSRTRHVISYLLKEKTYNPENFWTSKVVCKTLPDKETYIPEYFRILKLIENLDEDTCMPEFLRTKKLMEEIFWTKIIISVLFW